MGQSTQQVQMGVTKVLYRAEQHKNMELKRNIAVEATVIYLQKMIRGWLARRLRRALKKHKPVLIAAIKARTLVQLDKALSECDGLKFPLYEWTQAKELKVLILEEQRVTALLESLLKKDPEECLDALSKAVGAADDIKLDNDVAHKARHVLTEIQDRKKV